EGGRTGGLIAGRYGRDGGRRIALSRAPERLKASFRNEFLVGLCYSRGEKSWSWLRSTGCLQVRQRPAQQRRTGCRSSTACGSVRPAAGLLGRAARAWGRRAGGCRARRGGGGGGRGGARSGGGAVTASVAD